MIEVLQSDSDLGYGTKQYLHCLASIKLLVKVLVAIQINLRADRRSMLLSKDFQITNLDTYFGNHPTNIAAVDLGK